MSSKKQFTDACIAGGLSSQTISTLCRKVAGRWNKGLETLSKKSPADLEELERQYGLQVDAAHSLHDYFAGRSIAKRRWAPPAHDDYRGRWVESREYNSPRITHTATLQEHVAMFPDSRWAD